MQGVEAAVAAVATAPPAPKLERGRSGGMRQYGRMFQAVADILEARDLVAPVSSCPTTFPAWWREAEADARESATDVGLEGAEEEGFELAMRVAEPALRSFLARAQSVGWHSTPVEERRAAVEAVLARPQIPQRTPAWYAQGKEVLTASEFATLFGSPRAWGQLVLSKVPAVGGGPSTSGPSTNRLACLTCEMGPFDWGIRFEPVVKQVLEARWGVTIRESGRIVHAKEPHLAASPDGIFEEAEDPARVGRLVEIKCPISRKIGEGIPFEYWCQMQIQMEVTGIGECDYVEVKLESAQRHQADLSGAMTGPADGHVWLLQNPQTCEMTYAYTETEKGVREAAGWECIETIPWRVAGFWSQTVVRDRAWFLGTAELRERFWRDVAAAREGAYIAPESSRAVRSAGGAEATGKRGGGGGAAGLTVTVVKQGGPSANCLLLDD